MSYLETTLLYARLAADAYNTRAVGETFGSYSVTGTHTAGSFYAATYAYRNSLVVAVRGTEGLRDFGDLAIDGQIALGGLPHGAGFTDYLFGLRLSNPSSHLMVVGDSYGGYEAMLAALQPQVDGAYAFDTVGAGGGYLDFSHYYSSKVQLVYTENWGIVGSLVQHSGVAFSNGTPLLVGSPVGPSLGSSRFRCYAVQHRSIDKFPGNAASASNLVDCLPSLFLFRWPAGTAGGAYRFDRAGGGGGRAGAGAGCGA